MWNYLFEIVSEWSEFTEEFFVRCSTKEEADEILGQYFSGEKVKFLGKYTDEEAERMGLDTY